MAAAAGHRGETLTSVQKCSHFAKTHAFIMQAWEELYCHMVEIFISASPESAGLIEDILKDVESKGTMSTFTASMDKLITIKNKFQAFASSFAEIDPNWEFWYKCVTQHAFSYISLFISLRSTNWDLRMVSLKKTAPIFRAFDRPCSFHNILLTA